MAARDPDARVTGVDFAPVLDAMREYIRAVEESDSHLLHKALDPNIDISNIPGVDLIDHVEPL